MSLFTLILPLVAAQTSAVTVQLRTYEVESSIPVRAPQLMQYEPDFGNSTVIYRAISPTEAQLAARAKKGEIKLLGAPVVKTLSGKQAEIATTESKDETSVTLSLSVLPTVQEDGKIKIKLSAVGTSKTGSETKELFNSHATFTTPEEKVVYFLAPMKQNRKRSLLVSVRVSKGS